jgi:hypothetical protein
MQVMNAVTPPTVAAPTPTYTVEENFVRSLYNSTLTYTDVEWFSPIWGGDQVHPDYAEAGPDGECMAFYGLGYAALQIDKAFNLRDDVEYVHVDFYANEETDFRIGFQTWADDEKYFPALRYTTPRQWQSVDFPIQLIVEAGLADYKNAIVLRIANNLAGENYTYASEIYVDNIYAYAGEPQNPYTTGLKTIEKSGFNLYSSTVRETLYFQSEAAVKNINIYTIAGQKAGAFQNVDGKIDVSYLNAGVYIVSAQLGSGTIVNQKVIKL